jgi:hypothetical protein
MHVSAATTIVLANDVSNMAQQTLVSMAYEKKGRKESKEALINARVRSKAKAVASIVRWQFFTLTKLMNLVFSV